MSYNIEKDPAYRMVLESTYLSLATGAGEDMMRMILDVYEEEENFEACAAIITAIENWKAAGQPTNVNPIW